MTSTLELLRQKHEDIETLKQLCAAAIQSRSDPTNPHPRLKSLPVRLRSVRDAEQLARNLITKAGKEVSSLKEIYANDEEILEKEKTNERKENENEATSSFYASLRQLRDIHRSTPLTSNNDSNLFSNNSSEERDRSLLSFYQPVDFSGEEGNGKFLDLQIFFHQYINLTKLHSLYYYQYIRDNITDFNQIPSSIKLSGQYENYLRDLIHYLVDFANRAHPLDHIDDHVKNETEQMKQSIRKELEDLLKLYESKEEMARRLNDKELKSKLGSFCLKIGGRPEDRINRLWKLLEGKKFNNVVLLQKQLHFLLDILLEDEKQATITNIQKKLSLSYQEIEEERKEEEINFDYDGNNLDHLQDNQDQQIESTIYNPKDVPLGWDGKPIPYWMYKLHGLNHEFKCEICGGATYKGPRLFERHFTEATHVGGLKRLGITYSKAFMMITRIQDALQLHQRLVNRQKNIQFDTEREVEVEDDNGNVMNLKTFNDLKRQGLL